MTSMTSDNNEKLDERHRKPRACLGCDTVFDSAWAGERICPRCRGSSAWRNGGSLETRSSRPKSSRFGGS